MSTRSFVRILCVAILASFGSLSSAQQAVSFAVSDTAVVPEENKIKVAVLMPRTDSPLTVFANSIVNGIRAENSQQMTPYEIILLPRKNGQNALSHLQDAALMGASVAIGPISRDDVNEVSSLSFLPLPVVSLNLPYDGVASPELLMNFSLSQEEEAKQIVAIALKSLTPREDGTMPNVAIFEADSSLEHRIADTFARELLAANIPFTRQTLTEELMAQPKFYTIDDSAIPKPELEELPDPYEDAYAYQRIKLRNERLMAQYRARLEFEEAPYQAAFLAMDARTAALVKPRLPRTTRVWGTSMINPGSAEQNAAASFAYDLQNIGFVDSPLLVRYNDSDFKAGFGVNPPNSLMERRLFSFGVDAYRLACAWMKWQPQIHMDATTGTLSFDQQVTADVVRIAEPATVVNGKVQSVTIEQLIRPLQRP